MLIKVPKARLKAKIRRAIGIRNHQVVVHIVDNEGHGPVVQGDEGGWFTLGGDRIRYPSAYSRTGWNNMVYLCDTREVFVGERWVSRRILASLK